MGLTRAYGVVVLFLVVSFLPRHQLRPLETASGNLIDCVDIYKQPALDNPLLKGHKIQMSYSSSVATESSESGIFSFVQVFSFGQGCPDGTIPILRANKQDLISENLLRRFSPALYQPFTGPTSRAGISIGTDHFYGAKAAMNIWSPECKGDQFSASVIRLASGPETGDTNGIYVGWAVSPAVYGDDNAHLFTFWKGGDGSTGCYDMRCPGFVQTDKGIVLGDVFNKTSDYGGIQQIVEVQITQDPVTRNWILSFGKEERQAGYWPKELFPLMAGDTGATHLSFGGITMRGIEHDHSPPMGTGNKPDNDVTHSGLMFRIMFAANYSYFLMPYKDYTNDILDKKACYGLHNYGETSDYGYLITFGGPGGSNC